MNYIMNSVYQGVEGSHSYFKIAQTDYNPGPEIWIILAGLCCQIHLIIFAFVTAGMAFIGICHFAVPRLLMQNKRCGQETHAPQM